MPDNSMNRESIAAIIRDFICGEFLPGEDPSQLTDTAPLIGTGVLDSISTLRLISFLEDRFNIVLSQEDVTVEQLNTVERITGVVEGKLAAV